VTTSVGIFAVSWTWVRRWDVLKFLRSRRNQWEWQEYRLATLFWHSQRLSRPQLDWIRRRAGSGNTYWAARNVYFRALGKHGTVADARMMAGRAEDEGDLEIVRGLVIGAAESGRLPDRHIREMGRDDADLQRLIAYFRGQNMTVPSLSSWAEAARRAAKPRNPHCQRSIRCASSASAAATYSKELANRLNSDRPRALRPASTIELWTAVPMGGTAYSGRAYRSRTTPWSSAISLDSSRRPPQRCVRTQQRWSLRDGTR
jgi:hypothetical protein